MTALHTTVQPGELLAIHPVIERDTELRQVAFGRECIGADVVPEATVNAKLPLQGLDAPERVGVDGVAGGRHWLEVWEL